MSSMNNIKTFSNKKYSTEQFVENLLNLPTGVETLISSTTNKINTTVLPVKCFKQNFTRQNGDNVAWDENKQILTVLHNQNTIDIFDLQVRQITSDGTKVYNNFAAFIIDNNSFQINVPNTFDLSEGTWQIFVMMMY